MILFVEDDPVMLEMLLIAFKESAIGVSDYYGAISVLTRSNNGVNIVVTDHVMTQRTGRELSEKIKRKYKLPVIIITGAVNKIDLLRQYADKVVVKPFEINQLKKEILETLSKHYPHENN